MKQRTIIEIIAFLFFVLFLYTGINKLLDYSVFKEQIALTPIFSNSDSVIAWVLPVIEILVSVILVFPNYRKIGFILTLSLLILFTAYILYILNIDENLPCSCGGIIELLSWKQHLVFNGLMMVLA